MPNRNVHEVMGHLGRDPEIRYLSDGRVVCRFSVATSNDYKKGDQWINNPPEWHNIVAWGELAEEINMQFRKGDSIMVRGKSKLRKYKGKDGDDRQIIEITTTEAYKPIYRSKGKIDEAMEVIRQEIGEPEEAKEQEDAHLPF